MLPALSPPPPAATPRLPSALALGMVGSLGEELLAQLVGAMRLQAVYVGVTQSIGSATARFRPWVVGHGIVAVDEAWLCLTDPEAFVPAGTPVRRYAPAETLAAAELARQCGARRLVMVAPLAALLQMSATGLLLDGETEVQLRALGFEQLVIVRPTAAEVAERGGPWLARLVRAGARTVAGIMLPGYAQLLSARTAAAAIVEAVQTAPAGVSVFGARELMRIVEQRLPELAPKKRRWSRQ
ncbi:MAG: hypothetical protein ACK5TK_09755 [Betaproteobacteria bacterium]